MDDRFNVDMGHNNGTAKAVAGVRVQRTHGRVVEERCVYNREQQR